MDGLRDVGLEAEEGVWEGGVNLYLWLLLMV